MRALKRYFGISESRRVRAAVNLEERMRELRRIGKDLVLLPAMKCGRVASPLFRLPSK